MSGLKKVATPPFNAQLLDRLMEERGLDLLVVTSKHNVQYLLGGYRFFMFDYMDAVGLSRYLPVLIYPKSRPDLTAYIGNPNEGFERDLGKLWPTVLDLRARGSVDAMEHALEQIAASGVPVSAVGAELGFLPADAFEILRAGLPDTTISDCVEVLEAMRAVKTDHELGDLRFASEGVVGAMLATFSRMQPGQTKHEIVEILRQEEGQRGLLFEYCLITAGASLNRAPSDQRLKEGDIVSLDSGGNYHGYIGDLCRMGFLGDPSAELEDALAVVDEIQHAARVPIKNGAVGGDIFAATHRLTSVSREGRLSFVAHGMGLIAHEAPRLLSDGPIPYLAPHRDQALEKGMVLSIETTWQHPRLGFIKLEDTVIVTERGCEGCGDWARGWNRCGGR